MSATSPPAERLKPVEGNLQYVEEKSSYATQREQDGIARRQGKQVREKRMFEKLLKQAEAGTKLSAEAREWLDKKTLEDPACVERLQVRDLAKKSMSAENWAGELMKGSSSKFSAVVKPSIDDALQKEMVGLVSYDDLRRKKVEAADRLKAAEEEEKAAAIAERDPEQRKKKAEEAKEEAKKRRKTSKGQGALSFDLEEEEEG
mmetsp:Transcript_8078/g.19716  ORF Transcript_8078/g.19716 Transcript_8078/m.19716 type:complete len:203 (+) Transcript_8078:75-683(+)